MPWQIGSVTLDIADEPNEGDIQFVQPQRWASANPIGFTGRILQYVSTDAREHRLHFLLPVTVKDDLKALYDARAPVTFINPRAPFDAGVTVQMTGFTAEWNSSVRGESHWYDCEMVLVEQ